MKEEGEREERGGGEEWGVEGKGEMKGEMKGEGETKGEYRGQERAGGNGEEREGEGARKEDGRRYIHRTFWTLPMASPLINSIGPQAEHKNM